MLRPPGGIAMHRRTLLAAAITTPALAQQATRIIVSAPPGGAADVVGRLIADAFSERLGSRVIVENRAGAGGTIAAEAAARAAADGSTLFIGIVSTQVLVPLIRRVPYDAERDFAPIGMISQAPMVLLVNPALPVRTPRELVEYARGRPGGVTVSNGGVATLPHLLHEMFARETGLAATAVPYSGSATALRAVVSGEAQASFEVAVIARGQHVSGAVRAIAVTTPARDPTMPDVPTMAEAGLPGVEAEAFWGLLAPANTPAPILARMEAAARKATEVAEVRERLVNIMGIELRNEGPAAFAAFLDRQIEVWGRVIRDNNIRPD